MTKNRTKDAAHGSKGKVLQQKGEDADFLVEEFDLPVHSASELVAGETADADEVQEAAWDKRKDHDPLEGVPVPKSPKQAFPSRSDDMMQKNVVRIRKDRP